MNACIVYGANADCQEVRIAGGVLLGYIINRSWATGKTWFSYRLDPKNNLMFLGRSATADLAKRRMKTHHNERMNHERQ